MMQTQDVFALFIITLRNCFLVVENPEFRQHICFKLRFHMTIDLNVYFDYFTVTVHASQM